MFTSFFFYAWSFENSYDLKILDMKFLHFLFLRLKYTSFYAVCILHIFAKM